jgi:hypothetical protein
MRALNIVRDALAVLGVVWLCVVLYHETKLLTSPSFPWVWQEKGRMASPAGECDLVSYVGNRGAMSSFAYVCFLVKPGEKLDPNNRDYYEPILSSSHVQPKVRWENNSRLLINTQGGYVNHERPYSGEFKVAIEFQNEPLSPESSLP